jgi:hypothetical protein
MKNGKVHLINLGILFFYLVLLRLLFEYNAVIIAVLPMVIQLFINIVLAFINIGHNRALGLTYFLSTVLVLLIGFPSCLYITGF